MYFLEDNRKSMKRKTTCYIQGNPNKTMSRFFSRIFGGQKGMAQYIQNDERKNLTAKNTLPSKIVFLNLKEA